MSVFFNFPTKIKMLFFMLGVFVIPCDILAGSVSGYVFNGLNEKQEHYKNIDHQQKFQRIYNTEKHVFYWLYTRDNTDGQLLNRSEPHMIESTTYNEDNPIKVIVHGWLGTTQEKEGLCSCNVKSYLKVGEYNLICVDWKQYSTDITYAVAKARAKYIGRDIAKMLKKVTNMTSAFESVHVIGHSMGAHIAGFVGKSFSRLPRITGLDPAKPMYEKSKPEDRLDKTDAHFVDVIHTNAGQNGLNKSIGHMDFYPNGGGSQKNCKKSDTPSGSCSHVTSYHYFAKSIRDKEAYVAKICSSWYDFKAKHCDDAYTNNMGEFVDKNGVYGDYFLDADM